MRYEEFRDAIAAHLRRRPGGRTWAQLRDELGLPYDRACPTWTARLEAEVGLTRAKGDGRALVWRVASGSRRGARR